MVTLVHANPFYKANIAALLVYSPPVAGTCFWHSLRSASCTVYSVLILWVYVCRSTPAEAVEGERLGKRVRKKKKMFMESGDEEEDNIEEEEVIHTHTHPPQTKESKFSINEMYSSGIYCMLVGNFFFSQEKVRSSKGRRAAKVARLGW